MLSLAEVAVAFVSFMGLVASAALISEGASRLEKAMGQGLVGGIMIGLAETMPETAVVTVSAYYGDQAVALGSALGGNILLFTLGIGAIGVAFTTTYKEIMTITSEYRLENRYLLLATLALMALIVYGRLDLYSGLALVVLYFAYLTERFRKSATRESKEPVTKESAIMLVAGLVLGALSSEPFAYSVSSLSQGLGVDPLVLSLVIAPLATDVDAILTSLVLVRKSPDGASLGVLSLVGSKIENATILLGIIGLLNPLSAQAYIVDLSFFVVSNAIALYVLWDRTLGLKESLALLAIYALMIASLYLMNG